LAQNNDYFYGNAKPAPSGQKAGGPVANPGGKQQKGGVMDEANEDDFWYQAPKGSRPEPGYQSYIDSVGQQAK
jgi:hypothetical protein